MDPVSSHLSIQAYGTGKTPEHNLSKVAPQEIERLNFIFKKLAPAENAPQSLKETLKKLSEYQLSEQHIIEITEIVTKIFPHLEKSEKIFARQFIALPQHTLTSLAQLEKTFGFKLSKENGKITITATNQQVDLIKLGSCLSFTQKTFPHEKLSIDYSSTTPLSDQFLQTHGAKIEILNLSPRGKGIHDDQLKKIIQYCPNLYTIFIKSNKISDSGVATLSGLTSLKELNLSGCSALTSVDSLSGLISLKELNLSGCDALTSVVSLSGLTSLTKLNFSGCYALTSVDCLSGLTSLKELNLSYCFALTSVDCLSGLTSLKELNLSACYALTSVDCLNGLTSLKELNLSACNALTSVDCLSGLTSLKELNLSNCNALTSVDSLSGLTSLKELNLSGCSALTSVDSLSGLTSLKELNLSGCNALTSVDCLSGLTSLTKLNFSGCYALTSVDCLSGLTSLKELNLSACNALTSVDCLSGLTSLKELNLSACNALTSVDCLSGLTSLKELHLSYCSALASVDSLSGLTSLKELNLSHCNALTSVDSLSGLTSLTELNLSYCNPLKSVSLSGLTSLVELNLSYCYALTSVSSSRLTSLTELNLSGCSVLTNVSLSGLTSLVELHLSDCYALTSVSLIGLISLKKLNLSHSSALTSVSLSRLTSLKELYLSCCSALTSVGLSGLTNLTDFDLSYCFALKEEECLKFLASFSKPLMELAINNCEVFVGKLKDANLDVSKFINGILKGRLASSILTLPRNSTDPFPFKQTMEQIYDFHRAHFSDSPFKGVWEALNKISDQDDLGGENQIKKEKLMWLAESSFLITLFLNDDQVKWLAEQGILSAIESFGRPDLRAGLTATAIALAAANKNEEMESYLTESKLPWQKLSGILLGQLNIEGVDLTLCHQLGQEVEAGKGLFYVGSNAQIFIDALLKLSKADLTGGDKQRILSQILSEATSYAVELGAKRIEEAGASAQNRLQDNSSEGKTISKQKLVAWNKDIDAYKALQTAGKDSISPTTAEMQKGILNNLRCMLAILDLDTNLLKQSNHDSTEETFSAMLWQAFKAKVPIGNVDNFAQRYLETFGSSRQPTAITTYAGKIASLNDSDALNCLRDFTVAVLLEEFGQKRYELANNPHLQLLNSDLLQNWRQSIGTAPIGATAEPQEAMLFGPLSALDWLKQKLLADRDNHLGNLAPFPLLEKLLGSSDKDELSVVAGECQKALKAAKTTNQQTSKRLKDTQTEKNEALAKEASSKMHHLQFQDLCIKLAQAAKPTAQKKHLEAILKLVEENEAWKSLEFANDLQGCLKNTTPQRGNLTVIDSDDPYDLLLCGSEVAGSCQRLDGDPELNKGLLGYLMDGKIRLIAIKDEQNRTVARCLLRILWDGEKPVLFQSRRYFNAYSDELKAALDKMAIAKAKALNISIVSKDGQGSSYDKRLEAKGGPSPWEYCDDADGGGMHRQGRYVISDCKHLI